MIGAIIVGIIGIILVVLGYLLWRKERISILHEYHYDKVAEEDKKAFCMISGMGTASIGFFVGLTLLIYAGVKYNR